MNSAGNEPYIRLASDGKSRYRLQQLGSLYTRDLFTNDPIVKTELSTGAIYLTKPDPTLRFKTRPNRTESTDPMRGLLT